VLPVAGAQVKQQGKAVNNIMISHMGIQIPHKRGLVEKAPLAHSHVISMQNRQHFKETKVGFPGLIFHFPTYSG
jgi:hypothetical protein